MEHYKKLIAKLLNGGMSPRELSDLVIKCDKLDIRAFNEIKSKSEHVQESIKECESKLTTVEKLAQDIFDALYKYRVEKRPTEEILPQYRAHEMLIDKMMGLKEYEHARLYTQLDKVNSAMVTSNLVKMILEELPEDIIKQINEQSNEITNYMDELSKLNNAISGLQDLMQNTNNPIQKQQLQNQIQQLQQKYQQVAQQLQNQSMQFEETLKNSSRNIRAAVRNSIRHSIRDIERTNDFLTGWGMDPGEIQNMPAEEKIKLAEQLTSNSKLMELMKILGRMKRLALGKHKETVKKIPSEIIDIETGDNIERLLPSEAIYLTDETLEIIFLKKFAEKKLLQYRLEGKEKVAKGPIVCCVDNSGSMRGTREIYSKAFALGLLTLAKKEKRDFVVIHFGAKNDPLEIITFNKNDSHMETIKKIISMVTYFLNGGTDFEKPLSVAIYIIESSEIFKKATIVFITDGECDVSENWYNSYTKIKKELEFNCYAIAIETTNTNTLEKLCDTVIHANDILNENKQMEYAGNIYSLIG